MPGLLSFDELKSQVSGGLIDTVLVCFVDMQGRLMGKRFHAVNFVEASFEETKYELITEYDDNTQAFHLWTY